MKRLIPLAIVATLAVTACIIPSAGATDTNVCTLVTKKEASKILGAKVVKIKRATHVVTGDPVCEYFTNVYVTKFFKKQKAPLTLEVTSGPLTDELRGQIDENPSDLEPIGDLGDEAYFDNTDVIVIRGNDVLGTGARSWSGGGTAIAKYKAVAEAAARTALPRLPTG
jgi:hypothetical protein